MFFRRKLLLAAAVLSGLIICLAGPAAAVTTWDAAADFSPTSNPTGVWSYGSSSTIGGPLTIYNTGGSDYGFDWWNTGPPLGGIPAVWKNSTGGAVDAFGTVLLPAGDMAFHPGTVAGDEFSNVMFTAPAAGLYLINATFTGWSYAPGNFTTTDVHVLVNNISVSNQALSGTGYGEYVSYVSPTPIALSAGDKITFTVGWGIDGSYNYDTTGIAATINAIPLPPSAWLLGSGLVGLGLLRRKWSLKK